MLCSRRNQYPGKKPPDLPVQYLIRVQRQICQYARRKHAEYIARYITKYQVHGQIGNRIF